MTCASTSGCARQRQAGGGHVTGLTLTADSLREFAEDMLKDAPPGSLVLRIPDTVEAMSDVASLLVDRVQNPITRSDVSVTLGDADTATVQFGPGGTRTRTIPAA